MSPPPPSPLTRPATPSGRRPPTSRAAVAVADRLSRELGTRPATIQPTMATHRMLSATISFIDGGLNRYVHVGHVDLSSDATLPFDWRIWTRYGYTRRRKWNSIVQHVFTTKLKTQTAPKKTQSKLQSIIKHSTIRHYLCVVYAIYAVYAKP